MAETEERARIQYFEALAESEQYHCTFEGCAAPPFQTQYLLNSHANIHSQAWPHYCPVTGCPRSEGGKGFKRRNEMIRHGLVHESPGYVSILPGQRTQVPSAGQFKAVRPFFLSFSFFLFFSALLTSQSHISAIC